MNQWGRRLRLALFGESHGEGVGVVVDGLPPGTPVDLAALQAALDQRKPGGALASQRKEPDAARLLSGVLRGKATGAPVAVWIANRDVQSKPYTRQGLVPRPGHADWTNWLWSRGHADLRGGGPSSGRLTAPLVAAGALVEPLLAKAGIACAASLHQVGEAVAPAISGKAATAPSIAAAVAKSPLRTAHKPSEARFRRIVEAARKEGDSVGGAVAFVADGVPPAWGDPFFDSIESTLAHLLFSVPAVKGVSFGEGFAAAAMRGSAHNDPFEAAKGGASPATNHAGGILGGRTTGRPLTGLVAVKPASSIFRPQRSVDLATGKPAKLELTGRHDPCIAIRAVPVVQACLRLALADVLLLARQEGHA